MDKHNSYWMTCGPWYNTYICKNYMKKLFEEFIRSARTDRYNIMCSIDAHDKMNLSEHYDGIISGGYPLP